jgi:hypothetical protein
MVAANAHRMFIKPLINPPSLFLVNDYFSKNKNYVLIDFISKKENKKNMSLNYWSFKENKGCPFAICDLQSGSVHFWYAMFEGR